MTQYLKWWQEKPTTKNTLPSKPLLQTWWRNQKLSREAKVKRIQHHQTSFTTNVKGTSLGRKQKGRKRHTQNKPKIILKNDNRILGVYMHSQSLWSCPTLCDPMDLSLQCSSVHGVLLARLLERVAMLSSSGSF